MKKIKNGFTLLELVIVIVVVGILTAILIPTFASLIKKAKITNDVMIVKNLNTAMQNEENLNPDTDWTMIYNVIEAVNNQGYALEKLTPTAQGYSIVWDQNTNRFALLDEKEKANYKDSNFELSEKKYLWKVCKTKEEIEATGKTYSVYIGGNNEIGEITINNSIDVGDSLKVSKINYVNLSNKVNDNILIRTNNGTLTVNAPNDSIKHYGKIDSVNIETIAMNSYHEFGEVQEISIVKGRIVAENGSINSIRILSSDIDTINVEVKSNATVNAIASTNQTVATKLNEIVKLDENNNTTIITKKVNEHLAPFAVSGFGTKESPFIWNGLGANGEKLSGYMPNGTTHKNNTALDSWIKYYCEGTTLYLNLGKDVIGTKNFGLQLFQVSDGGNLVFDLAGHSMEVTGSKAVFYCYGSTANKKASITINDSIGGGNIKFNALNTSQYGVSVIRAYSASKENATSEIIINGGTFEVVSTKSNYASPAIMGLSEKNTKNVCGINNIVINNGIFKTCLTANGEGNSTVLLASQNENSKIIINDGFFETATDYNGNWFVINCQDNWAGKIFIYGGQYKSFNPANNSSDGENTNYVADGYDVTEKDGIYTVIKSK